MIMIIYTHKKQHQLLSILLYIIIQKKEYILKTTTCFLICRQKCGIAVRRKLVPGLKTAKLEFRINLEWQYGPMSNFSNL